MTHPLTRPVHPALLLRTLSAALALTLASACGGGAAKDPSPADATTPPVVLPPAPPPPPPPVSSYPLAQRPGVLAERWGKPRRLLVGLGTATVSAIQAQNLQPDIYDQYLVGVGATSWPNWNSPSGAYVAIVAANADKLGAVPMFTLYQMATLGDGNLSGLADRAFMTGYWDNVRVLAGQLAAYGKPALVNLEPDFWGYAHRAEADPTRHLALVASANPDCAALPDTVAGMGQCLLRMLRQNAPQVYVGFPPSLFPDVLPNEVSYLSRVGAAQADFVVMQTLDRDAGCFEARYTASGAACTRLSSVPYLWDSSNQTEPSFTSHFAQARRFFEGLQLPVLWWQTPLGVPSATPGGTAFAFRDNRVDYFLTRPNELVAAGGVGVVFSPGQAVQTNIGTDGGQFKRLSTRYFAAPAVLP